MNEERPPGTTLGPNAFVPESTAAASRSPRSRHAESSFPESIGPYRILSQLGEGGHGHCLQGRAAEPAPAAQLQTLWYDFACAAAVAGHKDDALEHLGQAIDHRFNDADYIGQGDDLKSLHGDPRCDALIARARQAAAGK